MYKPHTCSLSSILLLRSPHHTLSNSHTQFHFHLMPIKLLQLVYFICCICLSFYLSLPLVVVILKRLNLISLCYFLWYFQHFFIFHFYFILFLFSVLCLRSKKLFSWQFFLYFLCRYDEEESTQLSTRSILNKIYIKNIKIVMHSSRRKCTFSSNHVATTPLFVRSHLCTSYNLMEISIGCCQFFVIYETG